MSILSTDDAAQAPKGPEPNGCRHCGLGYREHFRRWTEPVGWHGWTAPTNEQRKARMLARRAHMLNVRAADHDAIVIRRITEQAEGPARP